MQNKKGDRFEKIRRFNIQYLAFVTFIVAYGTVINLEWIRFGKHAENLLHIPVILTIYLVVYERGYKWINQLMNK